MIVLFRERALRRVIELSSRRRLQDHGAATAADRLPPVFPAPRSRVRLQTLDGRTVSRFDRVPSRNYPAIAAARCDSARMRQADTSRPSPGLVVRRVRPGVSVAGHITIRLPA